MGGTLSLNAIGAVDAATKQASGGTPSPASARRHGDIVVDAISWPTRILMAGVIVVNLSLGAWLILDADFSRVKPQGSGQEVPGDAPADTYRFEEGIPLVEAPPGTPFGDPSDADRGIVALNERD